MQARDPGIRLLKLLLALISHPAIVAGDAVTANCGAVD
jgi:hypothetical protein